jgi:nicotinamide-nucleotide adenylyltransferase
MSKTFCGGRIMKKGNALWIGRFQPFHVNHLESLKAMLEKPFVDKLLIGIGSSDIDYKRNLNNDAIVNPFTWQERKTMIDIAVKEAKLEKRVESVPIPHYENDSQGWIGYIIKNFPPFSYYFTNSYQEGQLFKDKGKELLDFPVVKPFRGGIVREKLWQGNGLWHEYVPDSVKEYLISLNAEQRFKDICSFYGDDVFKTTTFEFRQFNVFEDIPQSLIKKVKSLELISEFKGKDDYFFFPDNNAVNMKLRGQIFRIKKLLGSDSKSKLERYDNFSNKFPINNSLLYKIFEQIDFKPEKSLPSNVTRPNLIENLFSYSKPPLPMTLEKKRKQYRTDGADIEVCNITFDNRNYLTVAIESSKPEDVLKAKENLGIRSDNNSNYLKFLKVIAREYM